MKHLLALVVFAVPFCAAATDDVDAIHPDAWMGAQPSIEIAVADGVTADTYTVNAVVSDMRSGSVLSRPVIVTRRGAPARAEMGVVGQDGMMSVVFSVTVAPSGDTADYTSQIRDNGRTIASQSATLAVTGPFTPPSVLAD